MHVQTYDPVDLLHKGASAIGSRQIVATGDDWMARTSAVVAADLMQGVSIDFRLQDDKSARPERSPWAPVRVANYVSLACRPRLRRRSGASMK